MSEKSIIEALQWRYATKKFDPSKKLNENQVSDLIEAVRLSATSYGLQAIKTVLVNDAKKREELVACSFNQQQIKDASHLLVLCREKELKLEHVQGYMNDISETRGVALESLEGFQNMIVNSILTKDVEDQEEWMDKQVYIALGQLLTTCAAMEIDSCPMEGFLPKEYDRVLGLSELNLKAVLVVPVGYRVADDAYAKNKKVRRSREKFVVEI
ncbi:MAG: NAD(P)H-dependent oxidoreductase [Crocinitomicaceae bacterium]|nr:NAD(P)H-dependent oxidoreductase [Crocinitomicaceae bacterium]